MPRLPKAMSLAAILVFAIGLPSCQRAALAPRAAASAGPTLIASSSWANPAGPYEVVMEEDGTLPDHTIYRPANLERLGSERLPIVAFSGPGCDFNGTAFRPFFTELASHGYLIVVSGPPEPRGGSGAGFGRTAPADLSASISWALAENGRAESRYFKRLNAEKVAVMGQSCGGLQALSLARDPRISTLVLWNSGVLNVAPPSSGAPADTSFVMPVGNDKTVLDDVTVPIAYFVGADDMAAPNAADDFQRLKGVPVVLGILEIAGDAHGGTFRENNGGKFAIAALAWLNLQLKGDLGFGRYFFGEDCVLCGDPEWKISTRGF